MGPGVSGTHLQRARACPQIAGIIGHAGEQNPGDAVATPRGIDAHLQNLQIAVDHPATGVAHQRGLGGKRHLRVGSVGGPPHAVGAPQLVGHERLVPRISSHHRRFQGRHLGHMARIQRLVGDALAVGPGVGDGRIVHGHVPRAALARQTPIDARQPLPLVLLGIGQARVHGQQQTRVMTLSVEGIALPRLPSGLQRQQKPRARRRPQRLGQKRARTFEKLRVLAQAVAGNQAIGVHVGLSWEGRPRSAPTGGVASIAAMARVARITVISHRAIGAARRAELFGEGLGLDHAVGGQPRSTAVIQAVFHGIHLAAHGVGHNEQLPALGRLPRAPGHCVQRGDAHKPYLERACDALRRRQGDAHAGERPRAAPHAYASDLLTRHTGPGA